MEEAIVATFNLFDLFVRLVPGVVFLSFLLQPLGPICASVNEGVVIVIFLALAYAIGVLMRALAYPLRRAAHWIAYGGNPRKLYASFGKGLVPVIKNDATRALAGLCMNAVCDDVLDGRRDAEFAMGWMISYLELHGCSEKEDRINGLVDTSSSLAAVFACAAIYQLFFGANSEVFQGFRDFANAAVALILIALTLVCMVLSIRYERIRFSIVIRSFAAKWNESTDTVRQR